MDNEPDVILLSNRGPAAFVENDGNAPFGLKRGAGGLAGALHPVARRLGAKAAWIASAQGDVDRAALAAGATTAASEELGYRLRLLDIDPSEYAEYYDVISNGLLWFAHHCLWDEVDPAVSRAEAEQAWRSYEAVNRTFATAAAEVAADRSLVLFQDYHLSLAPAFLKQSHPEHTILHFTHSSFCGPRGLQKLPDEMVETVARGMAGADLVGFHVAGWAQGFLDTCEGVGLQVDRERWAVEIDGRVAWVRTYPITIDWGDLQRRAAGEKAQAWARRFAASAHGPLIVRADRTEPSKNIVRGFEAFGTLLDRREDLRGKARFIACIYPSRQTTPQYRDYTEAIRRVVSEVNERHPDAIELFLEDDFDRTLGALQVYDVLMVNPLMDGMNLVAKEGTTLNTRDGVLVLSRAAGAFPELGEEAVAVDDPRSVEETTAALQEAVDLPAEERRRRAHALAGRVRATRPDRWIEAQLEDLRAIRGGESPAPARSVL